MNPAVCFSSSPPAYLSKQVKSDSEEGEVAAPAQSALSSPFYRISTSLNFQHYTGYPLLPTNLFRGLNQNTETVKLAPNGTLRLDSVDVANLRIARPTLLMEGRLTLEPLVDLFNLTNNNPVLARATSFGPVFLRPSDVLNPFVARFGLKINF